MSRGLFVQIDVGFWDNPKVLRAGEKAAVLYLQMLSYCKLNLTDGYVPDAQLARFGLTRVTNRVHSLSVSCLIERSSDDDGWSIIGWSERNRSRAEVEDIQSKRRSAGSRGGQAKAERASKRLATCYDVATTTFYPETETETETETENHPSWSVSSRALEPSAIVDDPAAVAFADQLVESIGYIDQPASAAERNYVTKALGNGWTPDQLRDAALEAADAKNPRQYLRGILRARAGDTPPTDDIWGEPIPPLPPAARQHPHAEAGRAGLDVARAALQATRRLDDIA